MPVNMADIYAHAPGSRVLGACPGKAQEEMIDAGCAAMPAAFRARTALNDCAVTSMDVVPDDHPNHFSSLVGLCAKLIAAAGKRSHFEGLLIVNVSGLPPIPANVIRLKALGELLAMKDGLASRCITLMYGPEQERELLACADCLDFDGRLKVIHYEQPNKLPLSDLLDRETLRCASPEIEQLLESTLDDLSAYEQFNAARFLRTCGDEGGLITERTVSDMLQDPYSYINRVKKAAKLRMEDGPQRRIGFQAVR